MISESFISQAFIALIILTSSLTPSVNAAAIDPALMAERSSSPQAVDNISKLNDRNTQPPGAGVETSVLSSVSAYTGLDPSFGPLFERRATGPISEFSSRTFDPITGPPPIVDPVSGPPASGPPPSGFNQPAVNPPPASGPPPSGFNQPAINPPPPSGPAPPSGFNQPTINSPPPSGPPSSGFNPRPPFTNPILGPNSGL